MRVKQGSVQIRKWISSFYQVPSLEFGGIYNLQNLHA